MSRSMSPQKRRDRLPWMPFYATDWLADEGVRSLTWEQRGIYFDMLCWQWREGSLPENPEQIRQVLGNNADPDHIATILARFFTTLPKSRVVNERLAALRKEQELYSAKKSTAAKARWQKQLGDMQVHMQVPADAHENQNQNQNQKNNTRGPTWLTPYGEAWILAYGGHPPYRQLAKQLRPLLDTHTAEAVLRAWRRYLSETDAQYASGARFASTYGKWATNAKPMGPQYQSVDDADRKAGLL